MKYKLQKQFRHKEYDYSGDGFYFVTICSDNHVLCFGEIKKIYDENLIDNADINFFEIGKAANKYWLEIPDHFPFVKLHEYIVMPNHIHGIIQIDKVGTQDFAFKKETQDFAFKKETQDFAFKKETQDFAFVRKFNKFEPQSKNLASIVRGFKIGVTKYARNNNIDFKWQPRYHDRIIRNDGELNRIRKYIVNNPMNWIVDKNKPVSLNVK